MRQVEFERIGERIGPDGRGEVLLRSELLQDQEQIIITKLANAADGLLVKVAGSAPPPAAKQSARASEDL